MVSFTIETSRQQDILDLTPRLTEAVAASGLQEGAALVSVAHCTCALYLNENEPGLLDDTLSLIGTLGMLKRWRHDTIDHNAGAHLAATLIGNSVTVPVSGGRLQLGTWQSVMLVELDGPRPRQVTVTLLPGLAEAGA
ncbi:MAG TPA: secondary thiamine-phosphate synthase enzyme YjbQ [Armatimonadota bacterium]